MKTILIFDDDRALIRQNKGFLEYFFGEDARVLVAYTTIEVSELSKEYRIDAFALDIFGIDDDEMDGVELAEVLRKNGYPYPVPIIIASKEKDDSFKNEVHKRIKFYDYITKPYEPAELAGQLKSAVEDIEYRPNPYFEINQLNHTYRTIRKEISHIEKVFDKRKIAIKRRDDTGKALATQIVPIESFKSFVKTSVDNHYDFIQCNPTTVVNLYWVERYCDIEKCVVLRKCETKIYVTKKFRHSIKKLLPTN